MTPSKKGGFYYPSLDGLRFFAFLFIFLFHAMNDLGPTNFFVTNFVLRIVKSNGWVGVDLFLVLSSFLITSILLKERVRFGNYSIKNFYIRRTLRIWPLYYLALLVGFLLYPTIIMGKDFFLNPMLMRSLTQNFPLYFIFLGNWAIIFKGWGEFNLVGHLWTISIEEQFYLIWPLLIFGIKSYKKLLLSQLTLLILAIFFRIFLLENYSYISNIVHLNIFSRFDTFMWGSILGTVYILRPKTFERFTKKVTDLQIVVVLVVFFFLLSNVAILNEENILGKAFGYLVVDGFFLIIVSLALVKNLYFTKFLGFKIVSWMGKLSYGLYVWHILGIQLTKKILHKLLINNSLLEILLAFFITLIFSILSYYLFEKLFLRFKDRFTLLNTKPV